MSVKVLYGNDVDIYIFAKIRQILVFEECL